MNRQIVLVALMFASSSTFGMVRNAVRGRTLRCGSNRISFTGDGRAATVNGTSKDVTWIDEEQATIDGLHLRIEGEGDLFYGRSMCQSAR